MEDEDSSACLVFNGEIYNFVELRQELIGLGHRFHTRSDTEVVLRAWQQWSERCVEHLRGMFAFVLWDARRHILFGARDRLGIKPLYYWAGPESFVFASELKALLACPDVPRSLDRSALEQFLLRRYVIAPRTILQDVAKLPPAHYFVVADGRLRVERYWKLPAGPARQISEAAAIAELRELMDETVRLHLVSDVPLGAFLSGGLDSSAIVAWMKRLGVADIKTFSIGYDSPESELPFAKRVAEHIGSDHYELLLTPQDFQDQLPGIAWHMDEPVGDEASLPLFFLARFAKSKVTVALSGEGSDEILLGYKAYDRHSRVSKLNSIPGMKTASRLAPGMFPKHFEIHPSSIGIPLEERYQGLSSNFSPEEVAGLLGECTSDTRNRVRSLYEECTRKHPTERMSYVDLNSWLPDDLLVKADRMTMAASLELRVPFLDHRMVEFAWQLPAGMKLKGRTGKHILKEAVSDLLPPEIIHRQKMGFPIPLDSWFRHDLAGFARETILASGSLGNCLNAARLPQILEAHESQDRSQQIYALLILDQWCRQFLHQPNSA